MNLRHIEIFHAVYVSGSISAAARALNVSQPSVSKMLRHAESLLGLELFQRTNVGLVPTGDAHTLFTRAGEIQDRVYALREAGRNLKRGVDGVLRVSALPALALDAVPAAAAAFQRRNKTVKFDLQTVHHDDLLRKLYELETDIAIAYQPPLGAPLGTRWLGQGDLVLLYREADMPDAPEAVELELLRNYRFISTIASGPIGTLLSQELDRRGVQLDEVASARTLHIGCALVRHGVGMTVVDSYTARASLVPGLTMRPLHPRVTFDVQAMYLVDRPPGALALKFLKTFGKVISGS
jgi:DNA-binding transcriptional LysR family regulator